MAGSQHTANVTNLHCPTQRTHMHTHMHTLTLCRGESKTLTILILAREEGLLAMSIELVTEEATVSIPLSCRVTA